MSSDQYPQPPQYPPQQPVAPPQYAPPVYQNGPYAQQGYPGGQPMPPNGGGPGSGLAIAALVLGIGAFVFCWVPIFGIVVAIVGLVLGIIALVKRQTKGMAITGVVLSGISLIISFFVLISFFIAVQTTGLLFGTLIGELEELDEYDSSESYESESETHEDVLPIGTEIREDDWTVTINDVDLDATSEVQAETTATVTPEPGYAYALVNVTIEYHGDMEIGDVPFIDVTYIDADGFEYDDESVTTPAPDALDDLMLYEYGDSETGNLVFEIPVDDAEDGVLEVEPTITGDTYYVDVR